MPVKKDATGRRYVQTEVEVPGTPEQVWEAIATGSGVSSWFVPTEIEECDGKPIAVRANFGPGMESFSRVTAWDPPHRFAAESQDMGPDAPTAATEWIVEARAGGTCVVRVVHSWFASSDDWDEQFEGFEHGWPSFFRILRLYLTHFRGMPSAAFQLMGASPHPHIEAWDSLTDSLGLKDAAMGKKMRTRSDAPNLRGVAESVGPPEYPELLLRLEEPASGAAHLFALPMGGQVFLPIRIYLYGNEASDTVTRVEPQWQAWMNEHFPAMGDGAT